MKKLTLIILLFFTAVTLKAQIMFVADLTGAQETPSVNTTAKATGWFLFNPDSAKITYRVTYAQLSGSFTGSHFHYGAAGVSGPVVHSVPFLANTAGGVWTDIPDTIIAKLLNEDIYINIHSSLFPDGEIRGQLRRVNGVGFSSSLFGGQEIPPVLTTAQGTAYIILQNKASEIRYSATVAGLSSAISGAEFQNAEFGFSGSTANTITFTDSTINGIWTGFPDTMITTLLRNRLAINIFTANNPTGEIRGQFYRKGRIMFRISMDGKQETPPNSSTATGTGWVVLSDNIASKDYSITYANLSSPFTAAHFHHGTIGHSGPMLISLPFNGNQVIGRRDGIADSALRFMLKDEMYANIHSQNFPDGEIRGQLELVNGIGFTSVLDGLQETPSTNSPAVGTGWLSYGSPNSETDTAFYEFTVANLTSPITGSHFHLASTGTAGPVLTPIPLTGNTVKSSWVFDDQNLSTRLLNGNIYANVHTSNFPDGEIRGQILFSTSKNFVYVKEDYSGLPEGFSLYQNYPNPFNPETKIKFSVPSEGFVKLRIYNLIGEEVAVLLNQQIRAGAYEVNWNAANYPSGIYFYKLDNGQNISVKKMILMK